MSQPAHICVRFPTPRSRRKSRLGIALYARCRVSALSWHHGACVCSELPCHLLDSVSRQQRKVVRATLSGELMGACDSTDKGILLTQLLHEVAAGDRSIEGARQRREQGGYCTTLVVYIDAVSVFAAVTASFIKIPVDTGNLSHVQYMRELLDCRVITPIGRTDTRDMDADGARKGVVDRSLLHECMTGTSAIRHEVKLWRAKGNMYSIDLASASAAASAHAASSHA